MAVIVERRVRAPEPMPDNPKLVDSLACPRCDRTPLETGDESLRCGGCRIDFPYVGGIPWLFAEPGATLGEWRGRLHFLLQKLEHEHVRLLAAQAHAAGSTLTPRRLERFATATRDHAARLKALLAPLAIEMSTASYETYLALRTRLPADQGLTTYYDNVHRDWVWGDEENEAAHAIVNEALQGTPPGRVLVLGAGAGRLAYDVHERNGPLMTVMLDFNPLLLTIAHHVTRGAALDLYEFPLAPIDLERQAVLNTLRAPAPARDGLHCVLADAHRPPFAKGSFDTVITPWLIDILPEPFEVFCGRVNALLAPEGRWINFGSLSFHASDPALRYSRDECIEIVAQTGFAEPRVAESTIPYMCSPASRHGRRERVLCFSATKRGNAGTVPRYEALPDWLVRGKEPVPQLDAFRTQAVATRVYAFIMSLIDGRRSMSDMAQVLTEQKLMTREEAEPAIRSFLAKMYEDSRRGGY
jgi:SAM-dependent methyltransferase